LATYLHFLQSTEVGYFCQHCISIVHRLMHWTHSQRIQLPLSHISQL